MKSYLPSFILGVVAAALVLRFGLPGEVREGEAIALRMKLDSLSMTSSDLRSLRDAEHALAPAHLRLKAVERVP